MISDSPPDRELEWTDEGIQSSKNLINRIERYFERNKSTVNDEAIRQVEKYVFEMEKNILSFSLNKCVANIYSILNFLEKSKINLQNNHLSKKILVCMFPIVPSLTRKVYRNLFDSDICQENWPEINKKLLVEQNIELPIQIKGKLAAIIKTSKGYNLELLMQSIYELEKIKKKLENKNIVKVINVQDKIINIITN